MRVFSFKLGKRVSAYSKTEKQSGFPSVLHSSVPLTGVRTLLGQTFAVAAAHNTVSLIKEKGRQRWAHAVLTEHAHEGNGY